MRGSFRQHLRSCQSREGAQTLHRQSRQWHTLACKKSIFNRVTLPNSIFCCGGRARNIHSISSSKMTKVDINMNMALIWRCYSSSKGCIDLSPQDGCVCGFLECDLTLCPAINITNWTGISTSLLSSNIGNNSNNLAPYLASDWESIKYLLYDLHIEGKSILDVGCGDGRVIIQALNQGATRAVGVELDRDVYRLAELQLSIFLSRYRRNKDNTTPTLGEYELLLGDGLDDTIHFRDYDIIFCFLLPKGLEKIVQRLVNEKEKEVGSKMTFVSRGWEAKLLQNISNYRKLSLPNGAEFHIYSL